MLSLFKRRSVFAKTLNHLKWICSSVTLLWLTGCNNDTQMAASYTVTTKPLVITMQAIGEVEATEAQRITSPGRRPMTIEWLAAENSQVKKGDVIVRFDAEQIIFDSLSEELDMLMISQDIMKNQAEQVRTINDIQSEQGLVRQEFDFTERFAIDDIRVYSKLEIIETLQNKDFLEAKDGFLDWRENSVSQQNESANAVLSVQRSGHEQKYNLYQESLSQLEIYAPFDGLLTYEKDKNGDKPSIGQTVYPGRAIAKLPNLSELQARVFVLAKDAIELKVGLPATVTLDAFPDQVFTGKVKNVSGFPRSITRGNPINYFEVVVAFDKQHLNLMKPGNKVSVVIENPLVDATLVVPIQALEHDQESSYVFVQQNQGWQKVNVDTGIKNHYFVEITAGLNAGDKVALAPQDIL